MTLVQQKSKIDELSGSTEAIVTDSFLSDDDAVEPSKFVRFSQLKTNIFNEFQDQQLEEKFRIHYYVSKYQASVSVIKLFISIVSRNKSYSKVQALTFLFHPWQSRGSLSSLFLLH